MPPRARQFSARLPDRLVAELDARAQRRGETRSRLAERYLEEGLRMDRHPGIVFRDGPAGRRAGLWRGPDVWQVVALARSVPERGEAAIAATAERLQLPEADIRAAIAYYGDHQDEIDLWIERNDTEAREAEETWRRAHAALA